MVSPNSCRRRICRWGICAQRSGYVVSDYLRVRIIAFNTASSASALAIWFPSATIDVALRPLLAGRALTAFAGLAGLTLTWGLAAFTPDFFAQLLMLIGDMPNFWVAALKPPRPLLALTATTKSTTSCFCSSV